MPIKTIGDQGDPRKKEEDGKGKRLHIDRKQHRSADDERDPADLHCAPPARRRISPRAALRGANAKRRFVRDGANCMDGTIINKILSNRVLRKGAPALLFADGRAAFPE